MKCKFINQNIIFKQFKHFSVADFAEFLVNKFPFFCYSYDLVDNFCWFRIKLMWSCVRTRSESEEILLLKKINTLGLVTFRFDVVTITRATNQSRFWFGTGKRENFTRKVIEPIRKTLKNVGASKKRILASDGGKLSKTKMKKVRRIFKLRPMARSRIDPEQLPLYQAASTSSGIRDRSPSIDSISTNSSSSSTQTRRPFRSYGSFLPNYFNLLRNSLRRSKSSQVRRVWTDKSKFIWMALFSANKWQTHAVPWNSCDQNGTKHTPFSIEINSNWRR